MLLGFPHALAAPIAQVISFRGNVNHFVLAGNERIVQISPLAAKLVNRSAPSPGYQVDRKLDRLLGSIISWRRLFRWSPLAGCQIPYLKHTSTRRPAVETYS